MASLPVCLTLAVLASVGPTVAPIDEARFRVRIVYDDTSISGHTQAQVALMKAAVKHCKGRGEAVSEGALTVNRAEPLRKGKAAIDLSEVYVCRPGK
jgi:hypothetical protein